MPEDQKPLQFVSNVVELKPDKKYLLVFKGDIPVDQLNRALDTLRSEGFHGVGIALREGQDLQVIEASTESWSTQMTNKIL